MNSCLNNNNDNCERMSVAVLAEHCCFAYSKFKTHTPPNWYILLKMAMRKFKEKVSNKSHIFDNFLSVLIIKTIIQHSQLLWWWIWILDITLNPNPNLKTSGTCMPSDRNFCCLWVLIWTVYSTSGNSVQILTPSTL